MHHLSALSSGYRNAANGTARIYARGTSTRAIWYSDFEASSSSTADVPLDSYGQAEVYVTQIVDVKLYTSSGAFLKTVTMGSNAAAVELISTSLTGTDYTTGIQGTNKPTTEKAAWDLWYALAGNATFGYVNPFGTGPIAIATAIGVGQGGEFIVTKYGALGDGTTNDLAALASANTAAVAAGGGTLVFPPGTYRITSQFNISANVSVRGCGDVSIISIDSATASTLSFSSSSGPRFVRDIKLSPAQTNTGELIDTSTLHDITCDNVTFGSSANSNWQGRLGFTSGSGIYRFVNCSMYHGGGTRALLSNFIGTVAACRFALASGGAYTESVIGYGAKAVISDCVFDMSAMTSGTVTIVDIGSAGSSLTCTGNVVINQTSGTVTFLDCTGIGTGMVCEEGNILGSSITPYATMASGDVASKPIVLASREGRSLAVTNNTAGAQVVDTLNYGTIVWQRTNNGTQTPTLAIAPAWSRFRLVWWNNHVATGGTITLAAATGAVIRTEFASDQFTVAADSFRIIDFVMVDLGGALRWSQEAESTDDEAD